MARVKKEVEMVEMEEVMEEEGRIGELEEEREGDETLFPNGPTYDQVASWKSQYGDDVFAVDFDGDIYIWRPIRRNEYKRVVRNQQADNFFKEEKVCETCVLWPLKYGVHMMTNGKAGVPSMLFEMIMEKSGFTPRIEAVKL